MPCRWIWRAPSLCCTASAPTCFPRRCCWPRSTAPPRSCWCAALWSSSSTSDSWNASGRARRAWRAGSHLRTWTSSPIWPRTTATAGCCSTLSGGGEPVCSTPPTSRGAAVCSWRPSSKSWTRWRRRRRDGSATRSSSRAHLSTRWRARRSRCSVRCASATRRCSTARSSTRSARSLPSSAVATSCLPSWCRCRSCAGSRPSSPSFGPTARSQQTKSLPRPNSHGRTPRCPRSPQPSAAERRPQPRPRA